MTASRPERPKPLRVLVADDDKVFTTLYATAFAQRGWVVDMAFDAMQALMLAQRNPGPDAIVLDLMMPAGTGYHTLQRLRQSSRTARIPVIVVTGTPEADAEAKVKAFGAAQFIKKPTTPDDVAAAIEAAVAATRPA